MQKQIAAIDFRDMVSISGERIITTSRKVADYFGKQHHHIIQKIEKLDCSDEFLTSNFSRVTYEHKGNQYVEYEISRDGAMYIIMSFTGKKAAAIKEAFIKAFNWMREKLLEISHSYQKERNDLMLEYMKEKDVASMSGRLLNRWGRVKKPQLLAKMERLEQQGQVSIPGLIDKAA
ncbi:Rha family transcriptional regulator [Rouxiella badensis]|uniref:Rha family transcriptional regulator n=1 Tax=Rouxiella badensis TaxID=1646377 RepID=UPI001B406B2E|nr:Rha family transcriptional regulator [Rouxiella badensis]MCC3749689.1 Rha family transcriptional regulator [Rouxiella badensis]